MPVPHSTQRSFYTQKLLHTGAFTHRRFYTQMLLHTDAFTHRHFLHTEVNFTSILVDQTSFSAKGLRRTRENRNFTAVLAIEPHFVRKGCAGRFKIAVLQFLAVEPRFVRKGCRGHFTIAISLQFFCDRTSFRAKGLSRTLQNRNFTAIFLRSNLISCERVAFRAVSLALPRALREK